MTLADCSVIKMEKHQFIYTCIFCRTNQQKSKPCSLFMGAPITSLPPAAAQHAACVYGNEAHVKYGIITLRHMPTVGLFIRVCCGILWALLCQRRQLYGDESHREWMDTGRDEWVQEAVNSGWRKQHLAPTVCQDVSFRRKTVANLHLNNNQVHLWVGRYTEN